MVVDIIITLLYHLIAITTNTYWVIMKAKMLDVIEKSTTSILKQIKIKCKT